MSIRSAHVIVAAATTLSLCPGPGIDGQDSGRPAGRAHAKEAAPSYPPHAPPVYGRPWERRGGERDPGTPDEPPPPVGGWIPGGPPLSGSPDRWPSPTGRPASPSPRRTPPAPPSATAAPSAPPSAPPPSGGPPPQADATWGTPVLVENFDGTQIDRSRWEVYHSPDAQVNPRTSEATTVHDGTLHMIGGFYGGKDLSGGVANRLSQTYGRWEVRFRGETGAGYSLVTLLWPSSDTGEYAEIDFAEVIDPTRQTGGIYVHRGQAPQAQSQMRADFTKWHTVAVDWLPGRLTFWLDGRQVWNYTGPLVPEQPMQLTLQNDVVCNEWSPCRNASTPKTVSMWVDWVRVFRAPGGAAGGGAALS
ncbi:glycoside hydrolase family 16 protein [Sphaerisporangium aureirubrum]|uniref:Glycoside hydrolase family 16 protein n=1 Tax=Sphaerisporangium aureirubrum TaxID=1544736 RepID=A0ABW1NIY6_9ACTN